MKSRARAAEDTPNLVRRMYDWVLAWADRPSGPGALFGIAWAEAFFFPIPPDVLLIPLAIGRPRRALFFAGLCTAGTVVGSLVGYWIGAALYDAVAEPILEVYGYMDAYQRVGDLYRGNLVVALGTAGFTPIPYKVFAIAAGGFHIPVLPFLIITALSRGARFFLVAALIRIFGESIRKFIDRYFNLLTILFVVLLVGGFVLIRYVFG